MNMVFKFISLIFLPLFLLSGCSDSPSSLVAQFSEAVSKYESCFAQQDSTCRNENKQLAISLYEKINSIDLEGGYFLSVLDFNKKEKDIKLRTNFNTAKMKMTKTLFADSDYNQAAILYEDTNGMFEQQESLNMLGILIKNLDSVSDNKKSKLAEIAESRKMPYETFQIKLSYKDYPYYTATSIITMLEKYNCYADSALLTNYFVKYGNSLYNELNAKYQEIMSNISKEDIKALNEKTRVLINEDQKPSLSSDCELNFYKKLK